jgi:hypothetical protein
MIEINEMSLEDLKLTKEIIEKRIAELTPQKKQLVLYTHNCKGSAKYHLSKYKHWAKQLAGIDATKTNGYAFLGEFLKVTSEHMLPSGSIVVEVCGMSITAYSITANGKEEIGSARTDSMHSFIQTLSEML